MDLKTWQSVLYLLAKSLNSVVDPDPVGSETFIRVRKKTFRI
jgi:hypothetical protein